MAERKVQLSDRLSAVDARFFDDSLADGVNFELRFEDTDGQRWIGFEEPQYKMGKLNRFAA